MKTLFAIRHATSLQGSGKDYDRPISEKGQQECSAMAHHLKKSEVSPDVILASSAVRTSQTAHRLAQILGVKSSKIEVSKSWYLAAATTWLKAVQGLPESAVTAFVVGHNPGMAEFVERMVNESIGPLSFRPLSVAHLEFDIEFWGNIEWRSGRLIGLHDPASV